MVKGYKPINHDAHSESAFRTLPVSEKPSIGKPLYDVVATNSNGMSASNAGFDAERYIHQKIREYTLRSAAHWSSVQDTLPQHAAKLQQQVDNAGEDERVLLLSVASAIDSASLRSLGLQEIPKALRAFALMHLLRNSGIAAEDMIRDGTSAGMALHPAVVHQSSASKVRVEHSTKHRSTGAYSDKVSVSFEPSSLSLIQGAVSLLLVLGLTREERTKSGVSTRYLLKRISEVCGKYEDRVDLKAPWSSKVSWAQGASKLCERCFGTAPIWYQQSMENGPPG